MSLAAVDVLLRVALQCCIDGSARDKEAAGLARGVFLCLSVCRIGSCRRGWESSEKRDDMPRQQIETGGG